MKTSIIFFILISASFLFSPNIQAQISDNAVRAVSSIDKAPKELNLDIIDIPIPETNAIRYIDVDKVAKSEMLYVYECYDRNGNSFLTSGPPTKELRYDCPICKIAKPERFNTGQYRTCWRCGGKGYLVSNPEK
jgi:hypothetical protein